MDDNFSSLTGSEWWRGSVIYQVYPRSLKDTNGDGIGDILGINEKLDYISSLGVDAVWVSPLFESPMKDFGYDISDYRKVDPIFGSNEDLDDLITKAHKLGLKIILDQVLSHTSDQHRWFQESRQDRTNTKADWYVWADPSADGKPPNNWISIFGGSAWQWEPSREQYYLHNFLTSQPDLNYHCDAVRAQILSEVECWLKRGIDGLRLDAINFCYHDKLLRDNPEKPMHERKGRGFSSDNPYATQYHYFDNTQPENLIFLEQLRALLDRYPDSVSLGEITSEDSLATMAEYTHGDTRLHMSYSFELLGDEFSAYHIKNTVETLEEKMADGWPCWAVSNHDVVRVVSRWGSEITSETGRETFAKLLIALLSSLRGTICTYQGEELGLTEAIIQQHQLQDPYGKQFWPEFKGRDGCRTPMPWHAEDALAGFSDTKSWLPLPPEHREKSVASQEKNQASVLSFYKQMIAWRSGQDCLKLGDICVAERADNVLSIERSRNHQTIFGYFNLSDTNTAIAIAPDLSLMHTAPHIDNNAVLENQTLLLKPYSFAFLNIP